MKLHLLDISTIYICRKTVSPSWVLWPEHFSFRLCLEGIECFGRAVATEGRCFCSAQVHATRLMTKSIAILKILPLRSQNHYNPPFGFCGF